MRSTKPALAAAALLVAGCDALLGVTDVPDGATPVDSAVDATHLVTRDSRADAARDATTHDARSDAVHHEASDVHTDTARPIDTGADAGRETGAPSDSGADTTAPDDARHDTSHAEDAGGIPRQLSPLSTAHVSVRTPKLTWVGAADTLTICADRSCTSPTAVSVTGATSYAVPSALPSGVYWWSLESAAGSSPLWELFVPPAIPMSPNNRPVTSWGTTLDVNGDGLADVAVGAGSPGTGAGQVYVYHGSTTWNPTAPSWSVGSSNSSFGARVANAGDLNGDGFADLVGASPDEGAGQVTFFLGSGAGLSHTGFVLDSPALDEFGAAVASAGDVNGDGYGDLVVTATGVTSSIGQAYLFFGGVDGPEGAPNLALTGTGPYTLYGTSVAGNCDVNGDGWPDLLVGAPQTTAQNNPPYPAGEVLVYLNHGGTLGPSATTTITDGIAGNQFGYSVACAGDVNDDGYADVIVGAIGLNAGGVGNAYIYLGGPDGLEASPIKLTGPSTKSLFGWSVASAGDINGDGYGDVIVGAPGATDIYTANGPTLSVLLGLSASGMNPGWSVAGAAVTGAAESYFFFGELGSGVVGSYMGESTGGTGSAFTLTDPGSSPSSDSFGYSVAGSTTN